MKALIFLLLLTVAASAQTLKWTKSPDAPGFAHDEAAITHLRGDAAGTVAVGIQYNDNLTGPKGVQICWFSNLGKLIHSDIVQGTAFQDPRIISVSPTVLVVQFFGTGTVLRKYSRRGAVVTFKDTPLPTSSFVHVDADSMVTDKLGFFVVSENSLSIQRYTVR